MQQLLVLHWGEVSQTITLGGGGVDPNALADSANDGLNTTSGGGLSSGGGRLSRSSGNTLGSGGSTLG